MVEYKNAEEMVLELANMVNAGSHLTSEATRLIPKLHRAIQTLIVQWCIQILRTIASQDYYDDRNRRAVLFAKRMVRVMDSDEYAMYVK